MICVEDGIDSSTAGGRLTLTILSAVAEIERENINVQFLAGKMQKLMNGGWAGGPVPFGYKSVDKKLEINQQEANVVKLIYDRYLLDDGSANGIAIWLNENGYTRIVKGKEKPFTYDFIVTVLDNPFYSGKILYNRRTNLKGVKRKPKEIIEVEGSHKAIISREQWHLAQKKRKELSAFKNKVDDPNRISLLSGIVKCPVCGNGLIATKNKSINKNKGGYYKTLHYYSCRGYRKSVGRVCQFKHTYNQEKIDSAVYEIVANLSNQEGFEKALSIASGGEDSVETYERRIKEIRKTIYHQEHEKNRLGSELDNLDILSDDYDMLYEQIQDKMDEIYDYIERLEDNLKKTKKKLSDAKRGIHFIDAIKVILADFDKFYEKMTCEERREFYRAFIERIDLYPEEQSDGRVLKSISFGFPVYYDEKVSMKTWLDNDLKSDEVILYTLDCSDLRVTAAESKATYAQIREYVFAHAGFKVSSLYIAQIKRKYGIDVGEAYNKPDNPKNRVPKCPKEKELAIIEALKAFRMLADDTEYREEAVG